MKKLNKKKLIIFSVIIVIILIITFFIGMGVYYISPVSSKHEEKNIVIPSGSSYYDIAAILKKEKLIKNERVFVYYLKYKKVDNIYAAAYYLYPDMSLKEIVETLKKGGHNVDEVTITFKEGINMRGIATVISQKTNNSYDDVLNKLKDTNYIDTLINNYWFLTDDIKNESIYYSLEGYLFPNTYKFNNKDVSVEEIFEIMLNEMDTVLSKYKTTIEHSSLPIHSIMTLASITQSEGFSEEDFKNIASVFYNRLNSNMELGSCVTSYYGAKKDMTEELYQSEIDDDNAYNTRSGSLFGLPVGPISNPSVKALDAVINPISTDYYYFVSDSKNNIYFTKTYNEHEAMISKLQDEGLWLEW